MYPPIAFHNLKFAIRKVTAFVGHSFSDKDKLIVDQLTQVLTKLRVRCDSGLRAEPVSVSHKVRERIAAAEIFVGIFTRRESIGNGVYSTAPWVIEEKAAAIAASKSLLLFVEDGVKEFGGMQGDYEYILFDRSDFATALIRGIDYVLSITSVPLEVKVVESNRVTLRIGSPKPPNEQLMDLKKFVAANPHNTAARMSLAETIAKLGDPRAAHAEFAKIVADHPNHSDVHHRYGHFLQNRGELPAALEAYQKALDLNPSNYKNNRCYGRCLYQHARTLQGELVRRSTLNKAKRLLERASTIGGQPCKGQIEGDLFVVNEAIEECQSSAEDV